MAILRVSEEVNNNALLMKAINNYCDEVKFIGKEYNSKYRSFIYKYYIIGEDIPPGNTPISFCAYAFEGIDPFIIGIEKFG